MTALLESRHDSIIRLDRSPHAGDGRSLVAGANAWFRAAESRRKDRILFDPWAHHLAERDLRVQMIRFARFVLPGLKRSITELQAAHCIRHRAIDALLLQSVEEFRQIVVVGAGYDMRASRFADRLHGVRWIEIDHPETQARKWERLANLDGVRLVETASINLHDQNLGEALPSTFDPEVPTCFIMEGLIHYLSMDRFESLLADLSDAAPRVRIIFSYIRTEMYERRTGLFVKLVKALREVPRLHFSRQEMVDHCERTGFSDFRDWDQEGQVLEFVPGTPRRSPLSQVVACAEKR